jgi:hypothetical protein
MTFRCGTVRCGVILTWFTAGTTLGFEARITWRSDISKLLTPMLLKKKKRCSSQSTYALNNEREVLCEPFLFDFLQVFPGLRVIAAFGELRVVVQVEINIIEVKLRMLCHR